MLETIDLSAIHEENARKLVKILLNEVEELSASLRDARIEIQKLRDENNRLKGEEGKPKVKASLVKPEAKHSSEKERRKTRERHKKGKKASLEIHRTEKVLEFLGYVGIQISPAQILSMLIHGQAEFHAESDAVFEAGLKSSPHQHIDDTPTRVNGQNQACHIICNPVYTSFHTRPHKDRLTILDVLRNGHPRIFRLNAEAFTYLENQPFSKNTRQTLQKWQSETVLDEASFILRLDEQTHHENTNQEGRVVIGITVPRITLAQQPSRVGCPLSGAKTRHQFRSTHRSRKTSLGYLHDLARNHQKTGYQFL
jgi:hypothetical protein